MLTNPISNTKEILGSMLTRQDDISIPIPCPDMGAAYEPLLTMFMTTVTPVVSIHDYIILYIRKNEMKTCIMDSTPGTV